MKIIIHENEVPKIYNDKGHRIYPGIAELHYDYSTDTTVPGVNKMLIRYCKESDDGHAEYVTKGWEKVY